MSLISKFIIPLAVLCVSAAAQAKPIKIASMNIDRDIAAPPLVERSYTLAPMGFIRFCMQYTSDCSAAAAEPMVLTAERQQQMQSVNLSVNRRIIPKADAPGQDIWSLNVSAGDCDDYAAQKRHDLIALGWPQGALLFAAVWTPRGEAHLVLVVKTDRGDFVLDNLRSQIVRTAESNYRWEKMQSARNPLYWVEVERPQLIAQALPPKSAPRLEQPRPVLLAPVILSDLRLPEGSYQVAEIRGTMLAY
jgi:predicted transglutaminase-like cysteine proteinase